MAHRPDGMAIYTYFELNADGSAPLFNFADFDNEIEARSHARALLKSTPSRTAIEVWRDEALVARVTDAGD